MVCSAKMAYKIFCDAVQCLISSSGGFTINQPTMNDDALVVYDAIIESSKPSPPPSSLPKVEVEAEPPPQPVVAATNWRKSSLSLKYNELISEMEKVMAEQKVVTDRQKLISLKERELELIIEIYYVETTMIRMELSSLRAVKI